MNSEILNRLLRFCSWRERHEKEVREKLKEMGIRNSKEIQTIIRYLKEADILSDERFLKLYVRGKVNIKRWGPVKIADELRKMGFKEHQFQPHLKELQPLFHENCRELFLKKKGQNSSSHPKDSLRIMRYLYGKGYPKEFWEHLFEA